MYCSYSWLKTEVAFATKTSADFTAAFSFLGFEPQVVRDDFTANSGLVVAEIIGLSPHPKRSNLTVCQVTTGKTEYQVICGAKNLGLNRKVIFALPNARLFNGRKITKMNFAGIRSSGMICALDEIIPFQVSTPEIVLLSTTAEVGNRNPCQYLPAADLIWKLEFTLQTRHLSTFFGLVSYLAQYWKLSLKTLTGLAQFQAQTGKGFPSSLSKKLILRVQPSSSLQLPTQFMTRLQSFHLPITGNFFADVNTYFQLFCGCSFEFKPGNDLTQAWSATPNFKPNTAFFVQVTDFKPFLALPPLYPLIAFTHLGALFNVLQASLETQTPVILPPRQKITISPNQLARISGQNFTFTQVKNLFDAAVWNLKVVNQNWIFSPPLYLFFANQRELIGEIMRLNGYQNLVDLPLQALDFPRTPLPNFELEFTTKITNILFFYRFLETRLKFQIDKKTVDSQHYQFQTTVLSSLCDLASKFTRAVYTIETIWEKSAKKWHETRLLVCALPPLNPTNLRKIKAAQIAAQRQCLEIFQAFLHALQIPLSKCQTVPVKEANSSVNQIIYPYKNSTKPLAKIGFYLLKTQRNLPLLVPYFTIQYNFLLELASAIKNSSARYFFLPTAAEWQQQVATFDLNLHFQTAWTLYPTISKSSQTSDKFDFLHLLKTVIFQTDKKIIDVTFVDLYQAQTLTLRIFWKVNDPATKSPFQVKLLQKVKIALNFLKNVKI